MQKRISINKEAPAAYAAMVELSNYIATTSLEPLEKELIKLRASQLNNCAFCINMHAADARKLGDTEHRIYVLSAWREARHLYTETEQAILALTEEVTLIANHGVSEETYAEAERILGPLKLSEVIMAIITINAWNRIGVTTHLHVAKAK